MKKNLFTVLTLLTFTAMLFGQQKYCKFVRNEKFGVLDENLQVIIPATISEDIEIKDDKYVIGDSGVFYTKSQQKFKDEVVTIDGKSIFDLKTIPNFESVWKIYYLNNDIFSFVIYKNNRYSPVYYLYDAKNQKLYESKAKGIYVGDIRDNSSSLIAIETGCYFSLLTNKNTFQVENRYYAYPFVKNRAVVGGDKAGKLNFQIIDEKNNVILDDIEQTAMCFSEGLLPVLLKNGQSGYVDMQGNLLFECKFFIDYDNWYETYGPKEYPILHAYQHNGVAVVQKEKNEWSVVTNKGESFNIDKNYKIKFEKFENDILPVLDKKTNLFGFINKRAELEISCQFEKVFGYNGKYWLVSQNGKDAMLSADGNLYFIEDLLEGKKLPVIAESTSIKIITTDGEEIIQEVDSEGKYLCLFAGEQKPKLKNISTIEGLEKLTNLEQIEFVFLDGNGDYTFLSKLKNLKSLYFSGVKVNSLSFLEKMTGLENIHLDIYTDKNCYEEFKNEKINLSALENLKEIYFSSRIKSSTFVTDRKLIPNFIGIKTAPKLDLSNNDIRSFSEDDVKKLSQYSVIDISYNPVAKNKTEINKINKAAKVIIEIGED